MGGFFLDPFGTIGKMFNDLLNLLSAIIEIVIVTPHRVPTGPVQSFLLGSAWGLGQTLVYLALVVLVCFSMVWRRAISGAMQALVISLFFGTAASYIFAIICEQLIGLGDNLTKFAFFYTPTMPQSSILAIPRIGNVLANLFALAGVVSWGTLNALIAANYWVIILLFKFLFPIALGLLPFGKRASQFFQMVVAMGLVSMVFGRPLMILIIEIGKWAGDNMGVIGQLSFVKSALLIGTLMAAAIGQVTLFLACYKAVGEVKGRVGARITGSVKATANRLMHPTVRGREAAHEGALMRQERHRVEVRNKWNRVSHAAGATGALLLVAPDPTMATKVAAAAAGVINRYAASKAR